MVTRTAPPAPAATAAARGTVNTPLTGLFDPYLNDRGGAWASTKAPRNAFRCHWACDHADEDIAALPIQFSARQDDWHALWLALPPADMALWRTPQRQPIGTAMLEAFADRVVSVTVFVPHHGALLVLIQLRPHVDVAPLARELGRVLDNTTGMPVLIQHVSNSGPFAERCATYANRPTTPLIVAPKLNLDERTTFRLTDTQRAMRNQRDQAQILLVEDDPSTLMLLTALIDKQWGCGNASDAAQAVDEYRRMVPDIVFLDIGLPDMNGLELLKRLLAGDPDAHVVMLTANATNANVQTALRSGAKGFLAKPFTRERLHTAIGAALHTTKPTP